MQETAKRLEFLLVKCDDSIHAGIHRHQVIGGRFHHPGHLCLRKSLLDGITHRQRMDDIADSAEFHDQHILHFDSPLIFSITFVVERPATKAMNSTLPP